MRSFISSFDRIRKIRLVPEQPWAKVSLLAAVLALVLLGGWEFAARGMGYGGSYRDTPGLWAISRDRLKSHDQNVIAIVGASRIRFDLEHKSASEAFGGLPVVNLSMNGSVARPVLSNLAQDESFRGIVICDYVPNLFWAPGGPNFDETQKWLDVYPRRTPAGQAGQWLSLVPESMLSMLNEDLTLAKLINRNVQLPNREGVRLPPEMPPYLSENHIDRRNVMWEKLETDMAFQERVKGIWKVLFSFAKPLPPELLGMLRGQVVADVEAIRSRGGDVIFVRFPSTGWIREFERETAPRETHWEPLLAETGSLGIHFEDYPELAHYDCPEWSHLTAADAERFSRDLSRIIQKKWQGRGARHQ